MAKNKPQACMATVLSNDAVMPNVFQLRLQCPEIAHSGEPGQFVMIKCGDNLLRRPISISDANGPSEQFSLLIAKVGKGTDWLSSVRPGDELDIIGALGNGFTIDDRTERLLLIGGGMGIAPLNFLASRATGLGKKVTLMLGARTGELLCPSSHLPQVNECVFCTEDASVGIKGRVTDCPDAYIETAEQIFACGPLPMYRALAKDHRFGGKPMQISLEVRMACGIGLCYGCTIKTKNGQKQVCEDGPVFEMDDILWDELADL
ncbi:dihydroorotate dehydrogenase electron transfer subunit [Dehalogenimonas etheniformans]|uniref:Dihydroorotate dehydrogenase electron transfer subunit n=1 Tax=Dehalogenimonas etheniformans TaxID=1536648 RepID=A0A2P5P865_9CHLR|nr:dihydroorotate dehydrogenase electron transfer subunit [Dehalogenimonas etheniformans]PPD58492.1 dihydroorotate dehydrogenase electron transfer subunit [Dehalogenimonas etheniformans]QNT76744.1 dihydroorotate dehydrogenase electron transfer subunit [Dehalogenimonas etheniformans]